MTGHLLDLFKGALPGPELLRALYGDSAQPGVSQVGKALERVLGLGATALWPLALAQPATRNPLQANLDRYRDLLAERDLETLLPVPPELGVPIAEKLAYVADPKLSELYLQLLAKAASPETARLAHPAFAHLIGQLSPDEATLLPSFQKERPFLECRLSNRQTGSWRTLHPLLTQLEDEVELVFPENIIAYLSNLEGLGLLNIRRDVYIASPPTLYRDLEAGYRPFFEGVQRQSQTEELTFEKGKLVATPFGKLFSEACL